MKKSNELGKFIAVVGCVLGLGAAAVFLFDRYGLAGLAKKPPQSHSQMAVEANPPSAPLPEQSRDEQAVQDPQGFYAVLKEGEYAARYRMNGTVKEISFGLRADEVKALLGNPDLEGYEDGEARYLVYQYGNLSIYFAEDTNAIDFIAYRGKDEILTEDWLLDLPKTVDSGDVVFYNSPTGYTNVKVDHNPEDKEVYIYLQQNYPSHEAVAETNPAHTADTTHAAQQSSPPAQAPRQEQETAQQGNGGYVVQAGEELEIGTLPVKNNSRSFTKKYRININYHFAYNNDNWVKVITDPKDTLELMPGEEGAVSIKVKASSHAPKGKYRYIVRIDDGPAPAALKDFEVEVR
ncbi:hypothetical protein ACI7RC_22310 [Brevibacillus sp. B_LB10_24]|uniref:hypothetical protein n=1 Tax=Brevibacillus sp. B_LB10_24 TaxID=3380645 RepID=UPI0038BD74AF